MMKLLTVKNRHFLLCAASVSLLVFASVPAHATFTIYSPEVTQGKVSLAVKSRFDDDNRASKDGYEQHLLQADYGVNDWWKAGAETIWIKNPGKDYQYALSKLTSTFELAEEGEYFLHPALRTVYVFNHENKKSDKLEALLLLQKQIDALTLTTNIKWEEEVGSYAKKDSVISLSARARYKVTDWFQPSVEYYNNFGEFSNWQDYDDQQHRIGPVWYGKLVKGLSFEAGYLFAVSKITEDGSAKFKLEYEFEF